MAQKSIEIFLNEIYYKGPKKKYAANKIDGYYIDETWS